MQDSEIVAHMLVAQSLVNALFHLAAWIAPGDYAPGAGTGAVVSVPATGYFFAWVRRQARATAAELILAVAVGTVVAAVAIGFLSCLTAAPVPSGQRSNRAVPHQPDNLTELRGSGRQPDPQGHAGGGDGFLSTVSSRSGSADPGRRIGSQGRTSNARTIRLPGPGTGLTASWFSV